MLSTDVGGICEHHKLRCNDPQLGDLDPGLGNRSQGGTHVVTVAPSVHLPLKVLVGVVVMPIVGWSIERSKEIHQTDGGKRYFGEPETLHGGIVPHLTPMWAQNRGPKRPISRSAQNMGKLSDCANGSSASDFTGTVKSVS